MKPVRCSWVDMLKVRESLSVDERGNQTALTNMRCVSKATVSDWKATCDVLDAMDEKVHLSELLVFQPTHARELARHMRKTSGRDPAEWDSDVVTEWVDKCESQHFTVEQFRAALKASILPVAGIVPAQSPAPESLEGLERIEALQEKLGDVIRKLCAARIALDEITHSHDGKLLLSFQVKEPPESRWELFEKVTVDLMRGRTKVRDKRYRCAGLETLIAACQRACPKKPCAGCRARGCSECAGTGYVPRDPVLIASTTTQPVIKFAPDIWEDEEQK